MQRPGNWPARRCRRGQTGMGLADLREGSPHPHILPGWDIGPRCSSTRSLTRSRRRGGGSPDRRMLTDLLARVGRELEVLSGRSFHPLRRMTSIFEPNGLPFVDIPDMQVGSGEPVAGAWEIPDPVNRQMAAVLQVASLPHPAPAAAPAADALWVAGQLVAEASRTGRLSGDYVLYGLGAVDREQRMELMRRVMDPAVRFSVPILGVPFGGWWIQIARRLIWVTRRDRGRRTALRAPAGQDEDRQRDRTARGRRAHPDRGSDDTTTRGLGIHRAYLDRGGSAPHRIGRGARSRRLSTATAYRPSPSTPSRLPSRSRARWS